MGQSSGGYAALRVGLILKADQIIAFAPQIRPLQPRPLYKDQNSTGGPSDLIDVRGHVNAARGYITVVVARSEVKNTPSQYFFDDHAHIVGSDQRPNLKVISATHIRTR